MLNYQRVSAIKSRRLPSRLSSRTPLRRSGGDFDSAMFDVAKEFLAPIILMHMPGKPGKTRGVPQEVRMMGEVLEIFDNNRFFLLTEVGDVQVTDVMEWNQYGKMGFQCPSHLFFSIFLQGI